MVRDHTGDWAYFDSAARQLFGGTVGTQHLAGGLHLYANNPVQFGPPSILVAEIARAFGGHALAIFGIFTMALCLPTLWLLEDAALRLARPVAQVRRLILLAGVVLVWVWGDLAFGFTHLDDALVLLGAAATANLLSRNQTLWAAVLAGCAAASKPWGVVLIGLLFAPWIERPWRHLAVAVGVLVAWWAPFLVTPGTLSAGAAQIPVAATTPLHLFDPSALITPLWVRPVQLVGGLALSAIVARRKPWAALLVGIVLRLLIDPGGYSYYWCGLVAAALMCDLLSNRNRPIATVIACLLSLDSFTTAYSGAHASIDTVGLLLCAGFGIWPQARRRGESARHSPEAADPTALKPHEQHSQPQYAIPQPSQSEPENNAPSCVVVPNLK
jgi:hypothetical protein